MAALKKLRNIVSTVLEALNILCAVVFWVLGGIVVIPVLLGLLVGLCAFICDFPSELKYLNHEIRHAVGAKRKYWICRRRRLWLSLIPFVKY